MFSSALSLPPTIRNSGTEPRKHLETNCLDVSTITKVATYAHVLRVKLEDKWVNANRKERLLSFYDVLGALLSAFCVLAAQLVQLPLRLQMKEGTEPRRRQAGPRARSQRGSSGASTPRSSPSPHPPLSLASLPCLKGRRVWGNQKSQWL